MGSSEVQAKLWGANPADFAELIEPTGTPIFESLHEALGVTSGVDLLDAACGAGLGLELASKRGANVAGFDGTPELLAIARERLPEADLRHADLEAVPWPDESFDVVLSCNGVQYAEDPDAALAELRRVVRPGGHVAVVTWGAAEQCDAARAMAAMRPLMPAPPPGAAGPFALSEPGRLEAMLERAGLTPTMTRDVSAPFVWDDLETAWRANRAAGPNVMLINHAGEDAVRAAFEQGIADFIQPDGTVHLDNVFRYAIGRR